MCLDLVLECWHTVILVSDFMFIFRESSSSVFTVVFFKRQTQTNAGLGVTHWKSVSLTAF